MKKGRSLSCWEAMRLTSFVFFGLDFLYLVASGIPHSIVHLNIWVSVALAGISIGFYIFSMKKIY